MKTFTINKDLKVVCKHKETRNGFKHEATLFKNRQEIDKTTVNYLNRTWESFEFKSVLNKLLNKTNLLTKRQKDNFLKRGANNERKKVASQFKTISRVAMLGDVFYAKDKKGANDWKARMLKAGLENKGLEVPEDWNTLSENEKEKRLNRVISELNK